MCCLLSIACCRSSSSKSKNGCSLKQLCKSSRTKVQPDVPAQFVEDSLSNRRVTKYEKFLSKLPKVLRSKISVANGAHLAKTEYNYWDMKRRMVPSWGITPPPCCPPKACSDLVYPCIFYDNSNDGRFPWTWRSQHDSDKKLSRFGQGGDQRA